MADTATWTDISNPVESIGQTINMKSRIAAKAGMAAAFAATGVSNQVEPGVSGTTGPAVGAYMTDVAAGALATILVDGSIVVMREGAGVAIDAGDYVSIDDAAATGCIKGLDTTATNYDRIGQALDDIPANGSGRVIIRPGPTTKAAA
jgi:hypothetical protein